MNNNGWIKLHRKFTKWGWYQKSEMVHLFLHFLLLANHEENEWQGNKISRGQFVTGLKKLKKDTGISAQTLRTCIGRLKSTGEITNKSTNRFRIITIINWEQYQDRDKISTSKLTSKLTNNQQTTNKQLTPNKKLKNDKNDKEVKEEVLNKDINSTSWSEWILYRKDINKKMSDRTIKLQQTMLARYNKEDQKLIINKSIMNGWTGLFDLKGKEKIIPKSTKYAHLSNKIN